MPLERGDGVSAWHGCPQDPATLSLDRLGTAWVPALGQPRCYDFTPPLPAPALWNCAGCFYVSLCLFFILVLSLHTRLLIPTGKEKVAAMVVVGLPFLVNRRAFAAQAPELLA